MSEPNNNHERLSSLERDVVHLDDAVKSLGHRFDEGFQDLRSLIQNQRQPFTAFAGWASVVLVLVGAVIWPLIQNDARHEMHLLKVSEQFVAHIKDGHPRRVEDKANLNKEQIDYLRQKLETHVSSDGHPTANARIEALQKQIDQLSQALSEYDRWDRIEKLDNKTILIEGKE